MKKDRVIEAFFLVLIILLFILSIIYRENLKILITKEVIIYGIIALFLVSFLLEFIPQYITPHILLIEAKIINFPLIPTFSLILLGAILGSLAGFEIGKKYGIKIVRKIYNGKKYINLKRKVRKYGKWIIALAAISPIPYVPMIFGSLGIKRKNFILWGLLMRILGLILFALFVGLF